MEVVRELDADILCLQEVDNYPHFWVKELSLLGYTGAWPETARARTRTHIHTYTYTYKCTHVL